MKNSLNAYGQTTEWEHACVHTRRNTQSRKKRLLQFLFQPDDKILDLGCGDGVNIQVLRGMSMKKLVGVDISRDLLADARKRNPHTKFYLASAEKLPFQTNTFDAVLVDSVFHHLLRYDKALKEIRRVLKPGGALCFIEPHKSFLRSLMDFICLLPIAQFLPILKERSVSYKGEIDFMRHWLATEEEFYAWLRKLHMQEVFCQTDFMSKVGKFQKI